MPRFLHVAQIRITVRPHKNRIAQRLLCAISGNYKREYKDGMIASARTGEQAGDIDMRMRKVVMMGESE